MLPLAVLSAAAAAGAAASDEHVAADEGQREYRLEGTAHEGMTDPPHVSVAVAVAEPDYRCLLQ